MAIKEEENTTYETKAIHKDVVKRVEKTMPKEEIIYDLADFFKILGDTDKKNYKIKLFTSDVSTIPMPVEEIQDPSLPEGQKIIVEKGFPGYRGSSYKQKENEKPVLLNSDYYKPKKQIVKVGTKKAGTEESVNND